LSRLVKTNGVGKQRDRLMKSVAWTLRDLAAKPKLDEDARDMAAYMALALHEIYATIDVTCAAWEKRDYWLKADQFRREWEWTASTAGKIEKVVLENQWNDLPALMAGLMPHLTKLNLPKKNTFGEGWRGGYAALLEQRGAAPKYVVK
jgi:hypothetical protein